MTNTFMTTSDKETQEKAAQFVTALDGSVVALQGELGAGKTQFVKGMAAGLGIAEPVQSPTFVLMKVYKTSDQRFDTFVHVDCYRLTNPGELAEIGIEEYLDDPWLQGLQKQIHGIRGIGRGWGNPLEQFDSIVGIRHVERF